MDSVNDTETSYTNSLPSMGHIPALDGLRAIAVILVLLTHANFQLGDNGILGVDIFFALSGFLITTLLLEEYKKRNEVSLSAFYVRRTFRLFPALYTMLVFVFLYALLFREGDELSSIIGEVISSALYLNNISWSWGWGDKGLLLGHTWSLAVEEQFYLLWPWFVILGLSLKSLRSLTVALAILIIVAFSLKISGNMSSIGKSLIHEAIYIGCLAALVRWTIGHKIKIPDYVALTLIVFMIIVGVLPIKWYKDIHDAGGRSMMALVTSIVIISLVSHQNGLTSRLLMLFIYGTYQCLDYLDTIRHCHHQFHLS
jgi:peptidoglycan/LPS O-acetylase OafA/YrhL